MHLLTFHLLPMPIVFPTFYVLIFPSIFSLFVKALRSWAPGGGGGEKTRIRFSSQARIKMQWNFLLVQFLKIFSDFEQWGVNIMVHEVIVNFVLRKAYCFWGLKFNRTWWRFLIFVVIFALIRVLLTLSLFSRGLIFILFKSLGFFGYV